MGGDKGELRGCGKRASNAEFKTSQSWEAGSGSAVSGERGGGGGRRVLRGKMKPKRKGKKTAVLGRPTLPISLGSVPVREICSIFTVVWVSALRLKISDGSWGKSN